MRRALAVGRKELHQISRDRRTLLILVFIPVFFLLLYGYALNFDIRHVRLAVEDRDGTPQSRAVVAAFVHSGYFDAGRLGPFAGGGRAVAGPRRGTRRAGHPRRVRPRRHGRPDESRPGDHQRRQREHRRHRHGVCHGILRSAGAQFAPGGVEIQPPVVLEPRVWYNPELRSTIFLVPGLIAYICMITAVTSTALSIVREKETGTIEQVRMAPIGTVAFLVGKTIPYFLIALVSAALIVLASMALFDLPMRGKLVHAACGALAFPVRRAGDGPAHLDPGRTQQFAFQVALLVSLLPTMMLSGFVFPISSMPPALQVVTHAVPARYFLVALRGILLKGADARGDPPADGGAGALRRCRARPGLAAAGEGARLTCSACAISSGRSSSS
jgi:ABC-2 type transport system permease protein